MRTNIVINDQLIEECLRTSGLKTKKEVVEQALVFFLQLKKQSKIKNYRGKLPWVGDLNKQRTEK